MSVNSVDFEPIDGTCLSAYRIALANSAYVDTEVAAQLNISLVESKRCRAILEKGRLLAANAAGDAVPVNPELAEAELSGPLEQEICDRQKTLTEVRRQMQALLPHYQNVARSQKQDDVTVVESAEDVRREITAAARSCTEEILTMQPGGGRDPDTLKSALARDSSVLARGASMRVIYQHTARGDLATRTYVRRVAELGAEVRTTVDTFERLIIFDRSIAFVPQPRVSGRSPGAAIVTQSTVVDFLHRTFENFWQSSQAFDPVDTVRTEVTGDLRKAILQLMAAGLKDDVIARRLGMATRTCRRYMTGIMAELGAGSRFQAGVRAAHLGIITADD